MKQHKLLIFLCLLSLTCQKCENNGTFNAQQGICTCKPGFVGKFCNTSAYQLKDTQTKIPVSSNYTFAYFSPEEKVIYRFVLTFCAVNKSQQLDLVVFAQEQQKNGEIDLLPTNPRELFGLSIGPTEQLSVDKKLNQQLPKIVFGIKLFGKSSQLEGQYVLAKCQANSIFTISFLVTIVVSFFVVMTFFMLISMVIMLRKKLLERRWARQQQMKKMECVNKMMPTQKYETLIQQGDSNPYVHDHTCSICLCEFQQGQDVRKTPCGHIYHQACLDSWCNSHLSCPICRKNFQQEQEMKVIEKSLTPDTNNIRQVML